MSHMVQGYELMSRNKFCGGKSDEARCPGCRMWFPVKDVIASCTEELPNWRIGALCGGCGHPVCLSLKEWER